MAQNTGRNYSSLKWVNIVYQPMWANSLVPSVLASSSTFKLFYSEVALNYSVFERSEKQLLYQYGYSSGVSWWCERQMFSVIYITVENCC